MASTAITVIEPAQYSEQSALQNAVQSLVLDGLWQQEDVGRFEGEFTAKVGRHGVMLVKITKISVKPLPSGMGRKGDSPVAGDCLFRSVLVGSSRILTY